jgi:hypothetical protein
VKLTQEQRSVLEDSPDALRRMKDPVARQRAAAEAIEAANALMAEYAAVRRDAVQEVYDRLPTNRKSWRTVGALIGTSPSVAYRVSRPVDYVPTPRTRTEAAAS